MEQPILHHKIYGNDSEEIVVIFYGLFGSSKNWGSIARQLSKNRRTITVDLRNHGDSFRSETMNYSVMAEDIARFLILYRKKKICLLGHSMGGKACMTYALKFLEMC